MILNTGCSEDLEECLYVPECARNLVYVSRLENLGFTFKIGHGDFHCTEMIAFMVVVLCLIHFTGIILMQSFLNPCLILKVEALNVVEKSAFLWHKRMGHISKERIMRLVKNEILPQLDFSDLNVCIECIKGKQIKHITKKPDTRSTQLLELIHIDICGSFEAPSLRGERYFITIIDDYSRYGYTYLLHKKFKYVNDLEVFIDEVERQLNRKVKVVRSDRGGEFYGKLNENGQFPGPFAKLLESIGICAQYTMLGTPQQNGIAKRRNRTLIEMVRSMLSNTLPLSLWIYPLMTATYVLNQVPSKAVPKTLFELWIGRKPSLRHLRLWGCPAEVRLCNAHEKKLDSRTVSGFFIGYLEKSRGYVFYCPKHSTRVVETGNASFN